MDELLAKGELSDLDLKQIANSLGMNISIYEYDKLPKRLKPGNYIILLGIGHGHWTGLYVMKNTCAYYDSYATTPPKEIVNSIGRRILFFSDIEEQRLNMNHCGQFVLRFLAKMTNKI